MGETWQTANGPSLETSAHCLVSTTPVGAWSTDRTSCRGSPLDYRPPHLRIDVVKGVEGGSKRRGVVIRNQHLHCAPHIGGVPTLELMMPLGWAQEAC